MYELLNALGEFITAPIFRWLFIFLSVIINIIKYYNEPHRFSYNIAFTGLSFKWHLYLIAIISAVSYFFIIMVLWINIPFTTYLPDNWYVYLFIITLAIITQIAINTEQIKDDGSFNPPPTFMLPHKYRVMITFISVVICIVIMIQAFIYYGITDISKKTMLSKFFLDRFGGWVDGNKIYFMYEWSGMIDIFISIYVLYIQTDFQACKYNLPPSWNF